MPEPGPDTSSTRAPAARTPEPEPRERTGRQRLWEAFVKPSRGQLVAGLLLMLVGYAAVVQVRASDLDNTYAGYREQDLIDVLTGLTGASQKAESDLARLERTRRDLRSVNSRREAALDQARDSITTYNILAGLVPVTGPGLRVTINEGTGTPTLETMVDMVQELRNAGAEAMQFNGKVRVVAQTAVESGLGGLRVDGQLLSPPYVVDVIGDPTTLRTGMTFRRGPVEQLQEDGAVVEMQDYSALDIAAVREPVKPEFAKAGTG